ncbi:hypothetical protein BJ508DRAFT_302150 [Ascobolus immersus RN42]|uniref:Uncharacterized protein n=1 Tax=Ascobolus immersus RN42 TaxID=1160509 RepID=A0A3N4IX81_ASCIM|nr:hypothetical protein BJ508DRAFT_302150 [Ascobolus immersus RN42]
MDEKDAPKQSICYNKPPLSSASNETAKPLPFATKSTESEDVNNLHKEPELSYQELREVFFDFLLFFVLPVCCFLLFVGWYTGSVVFFPPKSTTPSFSASTESKAIYSGFSLPAVPSRDTKVTIFTGDWTPTDELKGYAETTSDITDTINDGLGSGWYYSEVKTEGPIVLHLQTGPRYLGAIHVVVPEKGILILWITKKVVKGRWWTRMCAQMVPVGGYKAIMAEDCPITEDMMNRGMGKTVVRRWMKVF